MPSFKHPNGYVPSRTAAAQQQQPPYDLVQQNQMLLLQQQEMELQRREMEIQLQQMQLQSYLLQERIVQQQQQQQQLLYSNDSSFVGQLPPVFTPSPQLPVSVSDSSLFRTGGMPGHATPRPSQHQHQQQQQQTRLSANLDQTNRNSTELSPNLRSRASPRLSFGAGDARASLAASALARRSRTSGVFANDSDDHRSDVSSPRKSFTLPPTDTSSEPRRTHHRRASSLETSFSSHNSTIGSNGPTLVLSKPGEYPTSKAVMNGSPTNRNRAKRITVHVQRPSGGGHITTESTSSLSSTNSSKSDLNSLDSYTSGQLSVDDNSDARSSSTITPKRRPVSIGSGMPAMEGRQTPPRTHALPPRPSSTCIAQSISRSSSPLGNRAMAFDAIASRQPRGPANDDELATKNFASRIRRKAIDSLRVGGRGISLNALRNSAMERRSVDSTSDAGSASNEQ